MILLFWLACQNVDKPTPTETASTPTPTPTPTPEVIELPEISEVEIGTVEPGSTATPPGRQLKRMTVAQARDSMEQISGGVHWGDEDESNWDVYANTLGVADYQLRVENDRSPSVMFQKFLDDAATKTCLDWLEQPETTFFSIEDPTSILREDVRSNIVGLRWRIQGKAVDETARIIDDYEALFFKVYPRTDSTISSWQTVCVAMFTHPDFFLY